MTQTAHFGESSAQRPSVVWSAGLSDAPPSELSYHFYCLGNKLAQTATAPEFDAAELFLLKTLNTRFSSAHPHSKLTILKHQQFAAEGREGRIAASLAALEAPQPTNLTLEEWKSVVEEVEHEGDED